MRVIYALLILVFSSNLFSQNVFVDAEKELSRNCDYFINAVKSENRRYAYNNFVSKLHEVLKEDNSFYYPFDSVKGMSVLVSEDSIFRVISWQLMISEEEFEYGGIVQLKGGKVYNLIDNKDLFSDLSYEVFTNDDWYGQLYYNLFQYKVNKVNSYILFGYKRLDENHKVKIAAPIYFEGDKVYFGKEIFEDTIGGMKNRVTLETSITAASTLNYNKDKDMIVYDHTISILTPGRYGKKLIALNVPDGSYHGYKWNGMKWGFVDKVFKDIYKEAPRPNPVLNKGKLFKGK